MGAGPQRIMLTPDVSVLLKGRAPDMFQKDEKIALFIDGSNLYAAARSLNFDIDYRRLLDYFRTQGRVVRAFYYTALVEDQEYSPIRPLVDWLDYNGYALVTKPTKEFTDAQGRRKIKGNMDIELAVDVMEMTPHVDHIILFSGDGDFRRLVDSVQRNGRRVTVISTVRSQPPMLADELRRQADVFLELQDIIGHISREHGQRGAPDGTRPQRRRPVEAAAVEDDDYEDDEFIDDEDDDDFEPDTSPKA